MLSIHRRLWLHEYVKHHTILRASKEIVLVLKNKDEKLVGAD